MIKQKTTKELLGESVCELAQIEPIDKLTVRRIVENCGLSLATFYRHFHDKYELVIWVFDYQVADVYIDFCDGIASWRETLADILSILERDISFYRNVLMNMSGSESFFESSRRRSSELIWRHIERMAGDAACEELAFSVELYLMGVSCEAAAWIFDVNRRPAARMAELLADAMPGRLRSYLE